MANFIARKAMLTFLSLDSSTEDELEAHGSELAEEGACLVAVWCKRNGHICVISNTSEAMSNAILAQAVMEGAVQEGTAH